MTPTQTVKQYGEFAVDRRQARRPRRHRRR